MNIFEDVKMQIPIRKVAEDYGYQVRGGKIACPWHDEEEPSCHLYEDSNSLYCFGACRKGRSAIDLAMKHEEVESPLEAAIKLADKYHVPYNIGEEDRQCFEEDQKEREEVWDVLTAAVEIYHDNLTPEICQILLEEWGLTEETAHRYKFGLAPGVGKYIEAELQGKGFDAELIQRSGLLTQGGYDHFQGRITFPYWKNGKVVYLIGRRVDGLTPDKEHEKAKYKKLLVHSKNNPHISKVVQNAYFAGEDSVIGAEEIIITEGITDCYAAIQKGLACISPATVSFRREDLPRLLKLLRRAKIVYICNDTEDSGAGEKGAFNTAELLENEGIPVKIIRLPKEEC